MLRRKFCIAQDGKGKEGKPIVKNNEKNILYD